MKIRNLNEDYKTNIGDFWNGLRQYAEKTSIVQDNLGFSKELLNQYNRHNSSVRIKDFPGNYGNGAIVEMTAIEKVVYVQFHTNYQEKIYNKMVNHIDEFKKMIYDFKDEFVFKDHNNVIQVQWDYDKTIYEHPEDWEKCYDWLLNTVKNFIKYYQNSMLSKYDKKNNL